MKIYNNEFRSYGGAEVEEESACSAPVAVWSVRPKVLEVTRSLTLAHVLKDLGLCFRAFLPLLRSDFNLTVP